MLPFFLILSQRFFPLKFGSNFAVRSALIIQYFFLTLSVFKFYLVIIATLVFHGIRAQQELFFLDKDTIKYDHRTGGKRIDSLDLYHASPISLNPGGAWFHPFKSQQQDFLNVLESMNSPFFAVQTTPINYTSLPHLGFMYSFGSKAAQFVHADYQQQLNAKNFLNLSYDQVGQGQMIRNGQVKNTLIRLKFGHEGIRYRNLIDFYFQNSNQHHNGGLRDSSTTSEFPLSFLLVNKSNAESKANQMRVKTAQLFDFVKDSTKTFALIYTNQWNIQNRVYTEEDTLYGLYDKVYLDSFKTRDQFQWAKIQNAIGLYRQTRFFYAEALLEHAYWDYQNLARHLDTLELNALFNVGIQRKNWKVTNAFSYNFAGAIGAWSEHLNARYLHPKLVVGLNFDLENKLPDPFQRRYFSNHFAWSLTDLNIQKTSALSLLLESRGKQKVSLGIHWKNYDHAYFFIGNTWRNDTLTKLNVLNVQARCNLTAKIFTLQPALSFNLIPSDFKYMPAMDLRTRALVQKKIFKAQKLLCYFGVDAKYQSKWNFLDYESALGIYRFGSNATQQRVPFVELDAFAGFQIDDFRFYLRFENFEYLWVNQDLKFEAGYPITPFLFRVGLTWDFFN